MIHAQPKLTLLVVSIFRYRIFLIHFAREYSLLSYNRISLFYAHTKCCSQNTLKLFIEFYAQQFHLKHFALEHSVVSFVIAIICRFAIQSVVKITSHLRVYLVSLLLLLYSTSATHCRRYNKELFSFNICATALYLCSMLHTHNPHECSLCSNES